MDADVRGIAMNRNAKPNPELSVSDVILYVGELDDDPQKVADAIGYHDLNNKGIPYGFVFTDVAAKVGEKWSRADDDVPRYRTARAPQPAPGKFRRSFGPQDTGPRARAWPEQQRERREVRCAPFGHLLFDTWVP